MKEFVRILNIELPINRWISCGILPVVFITAFLFPVGNKGQEEKTGLNRACSMNDLSWISGNWVEEKDGTRTEETWSKPAGDTLVGTGRTIKNNKTVFTEYMQISREGETIVMTVYPFIKKGVAFKLVKLEPLEAVFENLLHDFPQRLVYTLQPGPKGKLTVHLEGVAEGKKITDDYVFTNEKDME